jgi:hypothetical protein
MHFRRKAQSQLFYKKGVDLHAEDRRLVKKTKIIRLMWMAFFGSPAILASFQWLRTRGFASSNFFDFALSYVRGDYPRYLSFVNL